MYLHFDVDYSHNHKTPVLEKETNFVLKSLIIPNILTVCYKLILYKLIFFFFLSKTEQVNK